MKKMLCFVLCLVLAGALGLHAFASGVVENDSDIHIPIYKNGDANGDGEVNQDDVTLIMQYAAGWKVSVKKSAADVTGDGIVDGKDSTLLTQYLANWKVTLK